MYFGNVDRRILKPLIMNTSVGQASYIVVEYEFPDYVLTK